MREQAPDPVRGLAGAPGPLTGPAVVRRPAVARGRVRRPAVAPVQGRRRALRGQGRRRVETPGPEGEPELVGGPDLVRGLGPVRGPGPGRTPGPVGGPAPGRRPGRMAVRRPAAPEPARERAAAATRLRVRTPMAKQAPDRDRAAAWVRNPRVVEPGEPAKRLGVRNRMSAVEPAADQSGLSSHQSSCVVGLVGPNVAGRAGT